MGKLRSAKGGMVLAMLPDPLPTYVAPPAPPAVLPSELEAFVVATMTADDTLDFNGFKEPKRPDSS